ncbi:MAG: DUF4160 domain-containing protein [Fusobacteriaceae bacterium]|nr:DUF4160 domain-containing protein [Fusobacteriaceae bacterium]
MPEISRFLGIIILMYFNEHTPPHFHARYNEFKASIDIESLAVLEGNLPSRVLGFVLEWAHMHQKELLQNWKSLKESGDFSKISPLT